MDGVKVVAFDADDTLWVNEPFFQATEKKFTSLLEDYLPQHSVSKELFKVEINNLPLYGYGVKSFMLSMVETALELSDQNIDPKVIAAIIKMGKELLDAPLELIPDIEEVLESLQGKYRLIMATKGDLLDQERKLQKSGLASYFHHTEIVSEKHEAEYQRIIKHLDIEPHEFLMIGNSLKSDVIPILNIGGHAFHVPYHTTWEHEKVDTKVEHPNFKKLQNIKEALNHL